MIEWLGGIDNDTFVWLNSMRSDFADTFCLMFSGKFIWVPMYAAILYTFFRDFKWQQAVLFIIGVALTITLADQLGAHVLRPIFERPRPSNPASPVFWMVHLVDGHSAGGDFGFPSCHAANTFALATLVSFYLKRRATVIFLFIWAIITCYSRIYLAAHYPGDLLAGALLGAAVAYVVYLLTMFVGHRLAMIRYKDLETRVRPVFLNSWQPSYYPSDWIIAVGCLTILYIIIVSL